MADEETLLVVFSGPAEGREDEYNTWYEKRHLPDVLAVPGVRAARRFAKEEATSQPGLAYRYLAIYELDAPAADVLAGINEHMADGRMQISDALDMNGISMTVWNSAGERQTSS